MTSPRPRLYVDAVDPLSYLVARTFERSEAAGGAPEYVPVELRPPPAELTDTAHPLWAPRWAAAAEYLAAHGSGESLAIPTLVPSSRKAHELVWHARDLGRDAEALEAVQRVFLFQGRDIGRVDVLVEIAVGLGLDRTEVKAVLDVDKHEAAVAECTAAARAAGIEAPCIEVDGRRLEGFHNAEAVGTFLAFT